MIIGEYLTYHHRQTMKIALTIMTTMMMMITLTPTARATEIGDLFTLHWNGNDDYSKDYHCWAIYIDLIICVDWTVRSPDTLPCLSTNISGYHERIVK